MEHDMDIASNVKLRLDDQYTFSISQEVDKKGFAEVALLYKRDGVDKGFVNCGEWAANWVADPTDEDDVVRFVDAHDVLELLHFAKEYVYIKDNR
jgi:hypothetical protein